MPVSDYFTNREIYIPSRFGVNLYNFLRLAIFPLDWFIDLFKEQSGQTLFLGCGYGIIETIIASRFPSLNMIASDLNEERIAVAQKSTRKISNIQFHKGDATELPESEEHYDVITFIDLLHHLPDGEQIILLEKLWKMLKPGGTLILKDVDTKPQWKYYWNYVHDFLFAGPPLTYYSSKYYLDFFLSKNASVKHSIPKSFRSPYNHYALVIVKPLLV